MGLPLWADMKVTVTEPGVRVVNGSEVEDWGNATPATYEYCWAYPAATVEDVAARDANMVGWYVLLPEAVPVPSVRAKITLPDGLEYQVQGKPKPVPSTTGVLDHTACYVERWEG